MSTKSTSSSLGSLVEGFAASASLSASLGGAAAATSSAGGETDTAQEEYVKARWTLERDAQRTKDGFGGMSAKTKKTYKRDADGEKARRTEAFKRLAEDYQKQQEELEDNALNPDNAQDGSGMDGASDDDADADAAARTSFIGSLSNKALIVECAFPQFRSLMSGGDTEHSIAVSIADGLAGVVVENLGQPPLQTLDGDVLDGAAMATLGADKHKVSGRAGASRPLNPLNLEEWKEEVDKTNLLKAGKDNDTLSFSKAKAILKDQQAKITNLKMGTTDNDRVSVSDIVEETPDMLKAMWVISQSITDWSSSQPPANIAARLGASADGTTIVLDNAFSVMTAAVENTFTMLTDATCGTGDALSSVGAYSQASTIASQNLDGFDEGSSRPVLAPATMEFAHTIGLYMGQLGEAASLLSDMASAIVERKGTCRSHSLI